MDSRVVLGGGVLLIGLGIWNSCALQELDTRLAILEGADTVPASSEASALGSTTGSESTAGVAAGQARTARGAGARRSGGSTSSGMGSGFGAEDGALDLDDPDVREALAVFLEDYEEVRKQEKREQGLAQYLDYVTATAESFAEENGVDDATMGQVIAVIEEGTYEYVAIEHAAQDGELDWAEARPQLKAIREEGKARLQELLGDQVYDEFEARVWGSGRD